MLLSTVKIYSLHEGSSFYDTYSQNVETRMVELNGEEEMLLQQIQEPGDLVFLQVSWSGCTRRVL